MKYFYGILCILGIILPYSQLVPWLIDNGLNVSMLFAEAARLRIGAFAWLDVIVSAVVLVGFVLHEGGKIKMDKLWAPIVGTCAVGVSLGLPLFLLLRELHLERKP